MTAKHSRVQAKLARYWGNYKDDRSLGGDVYTKRLVVLLGDRVVPTFPTSHQNSSRNSAILPYCLRVCYSLQK
ncbi:hypothetical protein [Microcoleus sp. FACHB-SPT15]|uniref:hypothetical protein n=1 Tax=Microcoleus sp. FACHB-SPT15 TaxID=2692830 RepID=UPI0028C47D25|nr:hypothetical protein [Microcoleus sp. FACHB-SPT15]